MHYTHLGTGGLRVSRIGLGCEPLGGVDWGAVDVASVTAAVSTALDLGVNFFDTADVYGPELSEERLARALGSHRRDVVIATKGGVRWERRPGNPRAVTWTDSSPQYLERAIEASLRRLQLETIPLYFVHRFDKVTPIAATMDALMNAKRAGKVQNIGLANASGEDLRIANAIHPLTAIQVQLNLLDRTALDAVKTARQLGVGVTVYGALAQGLLSGKFPSGSHFGTDDRRHRLPNFAAERLHAVQPLMARLSQLSRASSCTPAQAVLAWTLSQPGVGSVIAGAKAPEQILENTSLPESASLVSAVDAIFASAELRT